MRKRVTRSLIALLCAFTLHDASACYSPLPQQLISVDEQIARARDVTVAMAVSATPAGTSAVEYRFVVQQRLAGEQQDSFTLMGGTASGNHKDTSFDHHTAPVFWKHGGGRTINESDCIIAPSFVLGESYLVFPGFAGNVAQLREDRDHGRKGRRERPMAGVCESPAGHAAGLGIGG